MAGFVAAGPLPRTTTGSLELLPVAVYEVDAPNQLSCVCMAYVENAPHNPEVVGSNPAPATKNLQLGGLMVSELFCINTACGSLLTCQRCIAKRRTTAQAACSVVLRAWVCMVMIWAGQRFCPSLASMKKELSVRRDSRMRINSNHPDGSV